MKNSVGWITQHVSMLKERIIELKVRGYYRKYSRDDMKNEREFKIMKKSNTNALRAPKEIIEGFRGNI